MNLEHHLTQLEYHLQNLDQLDQIPKDFKRTIFNIIPNYVPDLGILSNFEHELAKGETIQIVTNIEYDYLPDSKVYSHISTEIKTTHKQPIQYAEAVLTI